jgi:hypothetical protein
MLKVNDNVTRVLKLKFHEIWMQFILGEDFNRKCPRWGSSTTSPRGRLLHNLAYRFPPMFWTSS